MSVLIETGSRTAKPNIPWVTMGIIVSCYLLLLFYTLGNHADQMLWLKRWSMHPELSISSFWFDQIRGALTAVFFHIQWLHLIGNMAFLMVFGWPVEKRLGHILYAFVFLFSGILVNLLLLYQRTETGFDHYLPVIGASGSISAIIGCYLGLFPGGKIGVYIPLGLFPQFARLPAFLVISAWFVLQAVYTLQGTLSSQLAWKIHLSGFGIGLLIAVLIRQFKQ